MADKKPSTPSKLEQKKVDKQVHSMSVAFSQAADEAFEAELGYVVAKLRSNRALTTTLSGLLKNDGLTALLDGRMHLDNDITAASASCGAKPGAPGKIRSTSKKWAHLNLQPQVVDEVLKSLDARFTQGLSICMGLNNSEISNLIHREFQEPCYNVNSDNLITTL